MIPEEMLKPRASTIKEKVMIRQKVSVFLHQSQFKEAEEAINEYFTGKKEPSYKNKKTKEHQEALDNLSKTFFSTLTVEINCATGKKVVYKDKKRPNIFEIEISEVATTKEEES